jgi:uncharacterized membrane protein (UPF0127 family)
MSWLRYPHLFIFTLSLLLVMGIACAAQDEKSPPTDDPPTAAPTDPSFTLIGRSKYGHPVMEFFVVGERFEMEISATTQRRERGLGNRAQFLPKTGMIFVHPSNALRSFWMKDCMFDIDLAYLDSDGRIVALHEMKREPPRQPGENTKVYKDRLKKHFSMKPARYALEFPSGTMKRLNFQVGQVIPLPHRNLRALTR